MANYNLASDEELLFLSRSGDEKAQEQLDMRYCKNHERFVYLVAPDLIRFRSICDLSAVAFQCYLRCLNHYEFGGSYFRNYYETCLRHDFSRVRKGVYEERKGVLMSLDETRSVDELTYHDVIPSSCVYDNPQKYVDYFEEVLSLNLAPSCIDSEVLLVARLRLDGVSFKDIASSLHISLRQAYYRYRIYEEEVKKLLKKQGYAQA